jgi:16S rRNA G1207 methylase RsmC
MSEHYFTDRPAAAHRPRIVRFRMDGRNYALRSDAGVFSADRLDPGTTVLLREAPAPVGDTLLDLGCGYGPLTCVLADRAPSATVWAVDTNARARDLTARNAAERAIAGRVRVCTPDEVPADLRLDEIWSNPPIRIGKPAVHLLLRQWLPRLVPAGQAWLVVARNLGADSLQRWLVAEGWECRRHASSKGYRVLRVQRPGGPRPEGVLTG